MFPSLSLRRYRAAPFAARPKLIGLCTLGSGASALQLGTLCAALCARCVHPDNPAAGDVAVHAAEGSAGAPSTIAALHCAAVAPRDAALARTLARELDAAGRDIQKSLIARAGSDEARGHGASMHGSVSAMASIFRSVGWGKYLEELLIAADDRADFEEGPPRHFFRVLNAKAEAIMERGGGASGGASSAPRSPIFAAARRELVIAARRVGACDFCAVVFVQERRTAHLFVAALEAAQGADTPTFRAAVLLGRGDQTHAQQAGVLRSFGAAASTSANVLVTTSAAARGIELPPCTVVVRTEPPLSIVGSIGAHSRAQYGDARYVVCVGGAAEARCCEDVLRDERRSIAVLAKFCAAHGRTYVAARTNWSVSDGATRAVAVDASGSGGADGGGAGGGGANDGAARAATRRAGARWEASTDWKSCLNLHLQKQVRPSGEDEQRAPLCVYECVRTEGPDHDRSVTMGVRIDGALFTGRPQRTKKQAEKSAAFVAIRALHVVTT